MKIKFAAVVAVALLLVVFTVDSVAGNGPNHLLYAYLYGQAIGVVCVGAFYALRARA